jgi:hypothetical protein
MSALVEVILPVFLVIAAGYVTVWRGLFTGQVMDALMSFTQSFAIPVLLFRAISRLDLAASYDPALLISFYTGSAAGFTVGLLGGRYLFNRPWTDSVAIGFGGLFSNLLLLGLPITERAYGSGALGPNFALISLHAPFCYTIGVTAMEFAKAEGTSLGQTLLSVVRSMARNPLVIGILAGFAVNLSGLAVPGVVNDAVDLLAGAALPAALFGLGGVLVRYRPEGDMKIVALVAGVSLILHPTITFTLGNLLSLSTGQLRSAVLSASMAPGVNTYVFANMYGVGKRVAATLVLVATGLSILSIWVWLAILDYATG